MSTVHRTQLTSIRETDVGTTPASPRMRARRVTSEDLAIAGQYIMSDEISSDRSVADPNLVAKTVRGTVAYPMVLPFRDTPPRTDIESVMYNNFTLRAERFREGGVAGSTGGITNIATTNNVVTVDNGTTFQVGHLVKFSGFAVSGNNGVFRCTTASATAPRFSGSGITDETAPDDCRIKVVGFQGTTGDITTTATGLGSTTLNFTALGLSVGDWIKIGGNTTGTQFSLPELNCVARIKAIAANALTLDHLSETWTTDSGTGKTISVWLGDTVKPGQTQISQTFERRILQIMLTANTGDTPKYQVYRGMVANEMAITARMGEPVRVSFQYDGLSGTETHTGSTLDATPDAAMTQVDFPVFISRMHVRQVGAEYDTLLAGNVLRSFSVRMSNNHTTQDSLGNAYPVGIRPQSITVQGDVELYFNAQDSIGDHLTNTARTVYLWAQNSATNQGFVISVPRIKLTQRQEAVMSGPNTQLTTGYSFTASKDETVSGAMISFTSFEYVL